MVNYRKPRLAFRAGILVVAVATPVETYQWKFQGSVVHPDSGFSDHLDRTVGASVNLTIDQMRKQIVTGVRLLPAGSLDGSNHPVPEDRIAVVLL